LGFFVDCCQLFSSHNGKREQSNIDKNGRIQQGEPATPRWCHWHLSET